MDGEKGCDMKAAGPLGAFETAETLLLDVLAAASMGLEVAMQPVMRLGRLKCWGAVDVCAEGIGGRRACSTRALRAAFGRLRNWVCPQVMRLCWLSIFAHGSETERAGGRATRRGIWFASG